MWVRILPGAWMSVCCECCVLSGRSLCDEPITHPEESYRLWCVVVCDLETSRIWGGPGPLGGFCAKKFSLYSTENALCFHFIRPVSEYFVWTKLRDCSICLKPRCSYLTTTLQMVCTDDKPVLWHAASIGVLCAANISCSDAIVQNSVWRLIELLSENSAYFYNWQEE